MRLGIIGRGPWGNVYAETLQRMGVDYWQETRNWAGLKADGVIVASAAASHAGLASFLICSGIPALIEKPLCLIGYSARQLLELANEHKAIVFTGHTRLYSQRWREFKKEALAEGVTSVHAEVGGPCRLDPLWDWGPHLVSMCLDLGFDPLKATIKVDTKSRYLLIVVNGKFSYAEQPETPRPLEVLLTEFMEAIKKGEPDIRGLELGVKVVEAIEGIEERQKAVA